MGDPEQYLKARPVTFEYRCGKWGEISFNQWIRCHNFFMFPNHELDLNIIKDGRFLYFDLNSVCPLNASFHSKVCLIDRLREQKLTKLRRTVTFNGTNMTPLAKWELNKVRDVIRDEDQLIVRCTFSVGSGYVKRDVISLTETYISEGVYKLSEDLKVLLLGGQGYDLALKIKDVEFPAHRAILTARSSVFRAMLQHDTMEKNDGIVNIDDCEPDCFQYYLLYLYAGKTSIISRENVLGLYWIADKYNTEELNGECLKFMLNDLSTDNFCSYFKIALRHNESAMLVSFKEFFAKNMRDIIGTAKWLSFTGENLVESQEILLFGLSR